MKLNSRIAVSAALVACGIMGANAQSFSFQSFGSTWSNVGANYSVNETVAGGSLFFNYAGFLNLAPNPVTALNYTFTLGAGNTVAGAGSFTALLTGVVTFQFAGTYSTTGLPQVAISDAATVYTLPTGQTLKGNISNDLFLVGGVGNAIPYEYNTLNAVPEPASFAVVGLGAIGLLARRRRK